MDSNIKNKIFKFPRTKHLLDASTTHSNVSRDDLLMDSGEVKNFLSHTVTVEEKIDGANLGISLGTNYSFLVQNRSHFVTSTSHRQFNTLDTWLERHSSELFALLNGTDFILFGEWLFARHSIHYTALPDYFIAFDIYDRASEVFLSRNRTEELLQHTSIPLTPVITEKKFNSVDEVQKLLETKSPYYNGPVEGVYLRINDDKQQQQNPSNSKGVLLLRSKIVRPDFIQHIDEQWTRKPFMKNIISEY